MTVVTVDSLHLGSDAGQKQCTVAAHISEPSGPPCAALPVTLPRHPFAAKWPLAVWYAMKASKSQRSRGLSQLASGPHMLPVGVLHRILACLPIPAVKAAAEAHPALAAAVRTLPELSHVRLRLVMQTGECPRRRPSSATNLMHPASGCYSYARK